MNVKEYLKRIEYRGGTEPTKENLVSLVRAHRFAVPYETLDHWRHCITTLKEEELYDKIVTRHRGGYCFELNIVFAWLLRELGYNVRKYFARWILSREPNIMPMRSHCVICVALDGVPNQLVDVGIGLPFMMSPIDFTFDISQIRDRWHYRIVRLPEKECAVEVLKGTEWLRLYSFTTEVQHSIDFEYAHWWYQTHPDSNFKKKLWVYRPLPNGCAVSIIKEENSEGEIVLVHFDSSGEIRKKTLPDEKTLRDALATNFNICF